MPIAIETTNLSKIYRLGEIGTGTLSRDFERWYRMRIRGQEDPFQKVGGHRNTLSIKGAEDVVYSLNNINLEIEQGDAIGIIGRNGSGKSTLLKIISRVTSPSTGRIRIKGRVASLLEVGTGFHPELTGRENIYLNGAILGMRKKEIAAKFDEIVDFSGVERYIDTPVKRYSSGMYVRLAFAVAAHLESEILIVDEVLAVGDAEFQKKCLGKMGDIRESDGRTVLFVSHNMASVEFLCKKGILLSEGNITCYGDIATVTNKYLSNKEKQTCKLSEVKDRKGDGVIRFTNALINGTEIDQLIGIETFSDMQIELQFDVTEIERIRTSKITIAIFNHIRDKIATLNSETIGAKIDLTQGRIIFKVKNIPFAPGDYTCNIYSEINGEISDWIKEVMAFKVIEKDYYGTGKNILINQGNILLNYSIK